MVQVAIMGHGVVGSGVAEVLRKNAKSIAKKAGEEIVLKRVLDLREFPGLPYADKFTKNFEDILKDPDIRIVVETMGGLHPAYEYVRDCLKAGKSVVTSNKELVAAKGSELLALAKQNNLNFLFEASVGGGIPILRPLDQCLAANQVFEIAGILNGTTNFMLTKMIEDDMPFDDALAMAQALGYAERDPSADVDGHDSCRKICILASLAFGKHVYPEQIHTEGIRHITLADVHYATAMDSVMKLIARAVRLEDGKLYGIVAPMILPGTNLLSEVGGVFNGIMVRGDAIGDVVFYGQGAGKLPTASAVVADIIDEVKHLERRKTLFWEEGSPDYVVPYTAGEVSMLVRIPKAQQSLAQATFGDDLRFVQTPQLPEEIGFVTPVMPEGELDSRLQQSGLTVINRIRIADM